MSTVALHPASYEPASYQASLFGLDDPACDPSFAGMQIKHYLRSNVAVYARHDLNLRRAEEGNAAARNLRHAVFVGIDISY